MLSAYTAAPRWPDFFSDMRRAQDQFNRLFDSARLAPNVDFPPVNIWVGRDGAIVTAEVPGVNSDQVEITMHQNTLVLRGKRDPELTGEDVTPLRQEREHGPFVRTVILPFRVDADKVSARFERGILFLELPRPEEDKPRQIHVARA